MSTFWCVDRMDHINACDGTLDDCWSTGMRYCRDAGGLCYGVMIHPGGWTATIRGFKTCTSRRIVAKHDWLTRFKNQDFIGTE